MTTPTMTPTVDIGQFIVRTPGFRHNEPHLAGSGISIKRIVIWYKLGFTPEEIADNYCHLMLAQVYAALTYYHANIQEIEALITSDEHLYDELSTQNRSQTRPDA